MSESPPPEAFVGELDGFFAEVPDAVQIHLEVRSSHLLTPPYFAWLETRGVGFVFSHWTWLPPLKEQWLLAGERCCTCPKTKRSRKNDGSRKNRFFSG